MRRQCAATSWHWQTIGRSETLTTTSPGCSSGSDERPTRSGTSKSTGHSSATCEPDASGQLRRKSLTVAANCWIDPDRAPEVREAAEHHLDPLRQLELR